MAVDKFITIHVEDGEGKTRKVDLTQKKYEDLKAKRWVKVAYQYGKYCLVYSDETGVCSTNTVLP